MAPLAQNGSQFGRQGGNPNQILNDCRTIDQGIDEAKAILNELIALHGNAINDANFKQGSPLSSQLEAKSSQLMSMYRELVRKIKNIKQMPESGQSKYAPQVQRVDDKLKKAMGAYRQADADYRRRLQEQMARQYRIVRPDASEAEIRAVVDDPSSQQQVFQQAMMQSDRRGQSTSTMNAVRDRHEAIQNIERQMIELGELFNDMDNLVMQQEAAVTNIELKGEEVVDHMDKGNQEIGTAIVHARNTRKWKWWCLCITGTLISCSTHIFLFTNRNLSPHYSYHRRRCRSLVLHRRPRGTQGHKAFRDYRCEPCHLPPRHLQRALVIRFYER
jgi:syntaxin 1B/2/3